MFKEVTLLNLCPNNLLPWAHALLMLVPVLFHFQGKQTLFAYCCRRSFCSICMVFGIVFCCGRHFNCWIQLWVIHHFTILSWPSSWHHLFCSSIKNEEVSCCSFSNNCHGIAFLLSFFVPSGENIRVNQVT